ncbi:hypothetical protein G7046_g3365 [Stylonectria norvegica]|nr:hypothetical protein G7046_g3365 [Stylonectria norvegica]
MSFPDSSPSSPRKRKRVDPSSAPLPSHLPHDSINPFSYTPGTILQFSHAGLSETDANPLNYVPQFPHRSLDHHSAGRNVESDSDGEADDDAQTEKKKAPPRRPGGHFDALLQSVHRFLDDGAVDEAARAYGLLLQLRPHGVSVDVRHHSIWALGAEILMRHGEKKVKSDEARAKATQRPKRWGSAANMNKVKAYFDTLIQQHPYDYKHPRSVSAVDFWLALLGCEMYNTHTEHIMALERLENVPEDWDEETETTEEPYDPDGSFGAGEARLDQRREAVRLQALTAMRDLTKRMDGLMEDLPYSKNQHFLRLRAMAALYVADLVVPVADVSTLDMEEAHRRRELEQVTARSVLQKILDYGGALDQAALTILYPSGEEEDDHSMPLFSSLPIRGL